MFSKWCTVFLAWQIIPFTLSLWRLISKTWYSLATPFLNSHVELNIYRLMILSISLLPLFDDLYRCILPLLVHAVDYARKRLAPVLEPFVRIKKKCPWWRGWRSEEHWISPLKDVHKKLRCSVYSCQCYIPPIVTECYSHFIRLSVCTHFIRLSVCTTVLVVWSRFAKSLEAGLRTAEAHPQVSSDENHSSTRTGILDDWVQIRVAHRPSMISWHTWLVTEANLCVSRIRVKDVATEFARDHYPRNDEPVNIVAINRKGMMLVTH